METSDPANFVMLIFIGLLHYVSTYNLQGAPKDLGDVENLNVLDVGLEKYSFTDLHFLTLIASKSWVKS